MSSTEALLAFEDKTYCLVLENGCRIVHGIQRLLSVYKALITTEDLGEQGHSLTEFPGGWRVVVALKP
jgi:hypothetical protein